MTVEVRKSIEPSEMHQIFWCLGAKTRLKLFLTLLEEGTVSSVDLAQKFGIPPSTARHHLKKLVDGGLVENVLERKEGVSAFSFYVPTPFAKTFVARLLRVIPKFGELPMAMDTNCLTHDALRQTINHLRFPYPKKPQRFRRTEKFFIDWLQEDMTEKDVKEALIRIRGMTVTKQLVKLYFQTLCNLAQWFGHFAREEADTQKRWTPIEEQIKNNTNRMVE